MEMMVCQSCGMPLDNNSVLGTEKNGELSKEYCNYCYDNGEFLKPNETLEEMIETCIPFVAKATGLTPEESKKMLEEELPKLKRWKN